MKNSIKTYFPFDKFRKNQKEVIADIIDSYQKGKKYYILEAPTGFGKSAVAFTASRIILNNIKNKNNPPIIVCTKTRQLQEQYYKSFKNYNIERLWASNHYSCEIHKDEDFYFGSPLCSGIESCYKTSSCKYLLAKNKFQNSEIGILNYHYFFHARYNPHILIMDEAHNIENILCGLMEVKISLFSIQKLCEILEMLQLQYNRSALVTYFKNVIYCKEIDRVSLKQLHEQLQAINKLIQDKKTEILYNGNVNKYLLLAKGLARSIKIVENLLNKLNRYFKSEVDWIVSENKKDSISIKPIDIIEGSNILNKPDFSILMSATICSYEQLCKELGIEKKQCSFKSISSEIPIENRKVYQLDIGSINNKNKKELLPKFVKNIDKILDQIKNDRGIIHSVSYENAKKIVEISKHSKRMIIPDKSMSIEESLLLYNNTVIVSPSITEGVDLKDNLSRFQIFFKVPYAYLGDKWVKIKMDKDYMWYIRDAVIKLVQGSGRSIRSKEDYATTFILDSNFNKIKHLLPEWYKEAVEIL